MGLAGCRIRIKIAEGCGITDFKGGMRDENRREIPG